MEKIIYLKSLKAKLTLERNFMMESYQTLMDVINTRKDILVVSSFFKDRIAFGKNKIALIKGFRKNLVVYYNLNPNKINEKIGITDVSDTISYKNYPTKFIIEDEKDLKNAIKLMEKALNNAKALDLKIQEDIDYNLVYPEKTFDELVALGLIKKYVRYFSDDNNDVIVRDNYEIKKVKPNPITVVEEKPLVEVKPNPVSVIEEKPLVEVKPNPVSVIEEKPLVEVKPNPVSVIEMVNVRFKVMVKGNKTDKLFLFTNYTNWDETKCIELIKKEDYFYLETKFPKNYDLEFKISLSKNWQGVEKGIFGEEIKNHKYFLGSDIEIEDIIYNFRFK